MAASDEFVYEVEHETTAPIISCSTIETVVGTIRKALAQLNKSY